MAPFWEICSFVNPTKFVNLAIHPCPSSFSLDLQQWRSITKRKHFFKSAQAWHLLMPLRSNAQEFIGSPSTHSESKHPINIIFGLIIALLSKFNVMSQISFNHHYTRKSPLPKPTTTYRSCHLGQCSTTIKTWLDFMVQGTLVKSSANHL